VTKDEKLLREMFEQHSRRVLAYARRHTDPASAEDIVADVFLVAWRRIADVPPDALPWLLVVARNTLANANRTGSRQRRLTDELGRLSAVAPPAPDDAAAVLDRHIVLAALAGLAAADREAILLVAWDELSTSGAAKVVGCSRRAFDARLARARADLRRALTHTSPSHLELIKEPTP
jgi:RNA polymerase sigma factor (sigma-70 family)